MRLVAVHAHMVGRDGAATLPVSYDVPHGSVPRDLEIPIMSHGLFGWKRRSTVVITFQWQAEDD